MCTSSTGTSPPAIYVAVVDLMPDFLCDRGRAICFGGDSVVEVDGAARAAACIAELL
jgi:hypothetical protein